MAADLVLNGAYFSASNISVRLQAKGGGSILFTSFSTLKLDSEVTPQPVMALGSYGPIGSTDGNIKESGEFSAPTQVCQYFFDALSNADPSGTKSPAKTEFTITAILSNGTADANYKIEARRCKILKRNDDFTGGDSKALVQVVPLLIIDGIYRNGVRLLNPQPTQGVR